MNINDIITEEIQNHWSKKQHNHGIKRLFHQDTYNLSELAKLINTDENNLISAFNENGDNGVISKYSELGGKEIETVTNGQYRHKYLHNPKEISEGYNDDKGIIKLYHRVGLKTKNNYPDLIKSVTENGLITNDNGEIGSTIWFSDNYDDYGKNGIFVVSLDFDTKTNGVANNEYGIVYQGHNAYAYNDIPFDKLNVVKIPVAYIGNNPITNDNMIKYIVERKFLNPESINSGKFKIKLFADTFNKYIQPYINIPNFIEQINDNYIYTN